MPSIVLSAEAFRDLEEIEDYTSRTWGDGQVLKYMLDIKTALESIADNPNIGRSRTDIPHPYLVYSVGSHLIIYRLNKNKLEVLNILHPSMNTKTRVKDALRRMALKQKST